MLEFIVHFFLKSSEIKNDSWTFQCDVNNNSQHYTAKFTVWKILILILLSFDEFCLLELFSVEEANVSSAFLTLFSLWNIQRLGFGYIILRS